MTKIIDISKHNGAIDFAKVKADGISGVIIRAGYGRHISQKDPTFETYYSGAKAAGLNVGAYWYSYADNPSDAKVEAAVFLEAIKGKRFELPLYLDIEEEKHVALGRTMCTAMVEAFCSTVEAAGYFAGVYSFDSFFGSNLNAEVQKKYSCWVARVENVKPTYCKSYAMHQYTWKGAVKGVSGAVDVSYCYKDFPAIIKKAGLNGWKKAATYVVAAKISGCSAAQAESIAKACSKMGMTTITKEEE
ncbi:MAG: glycoside hydrolase family 25 protein [Oscillospiraceae bacterium]